MADMITASTCLNCGTPLSGDARQGFCPKCLFVQASAEGFEACEPGEEDGETVVSGQTAAAGDQRLDRQEKHLPGGPGIGTQKSEPGNGIGDYELLEVIGRGGMGLVYRARQRSLDRVVAIKMTAFGPGSSAELVKRFRAEAVAAAALQHPNIVAIHDVGIHEDRHFFVMDYVEGQSLAQSVGNQPLAARRAAGYLKTIAEVVHYAHERGILHRDLKPSNVLIDGQDRPRVVDFGLARRLEGDSELTVTGQVLGSPHYLPPEQATGRRGRVSRRTDVYGLGATLYHLLTGRPPFQAESLAETLDLVLHSEPVAPRLLNPGLPRDLETICLKCLEKEPVKRYPTAQAVADELGRFLEGQPISARPVGAAGKAWRWCRRNPRLATAVGVAFLSLVIGLAGVGWQWRRAEAQRQRAELGELAAQRRAYASEINAAQQALKMNNPSRALELLNRCRPTRRPENREQKAQVDLRGFEWRYLWQQCQTEAEAVVGRLPSRVRSLELSPDAQWLLAGSDAGAATLWHLATGEEISLASERRLNAHGTFSPDGRSVLYCDQGPQSFGTIAVWDLESRKRLEPIVDPGPKPRPIGPIAFSPDGRWFGYGVVTESEHRPNLGYGVVLLTFPGLEPVKEQFALSLHVDGDHASDWVFTPDSRGVVFAESDPDRRIIWCDLVPGSEPLRVPGHSEAVTVMAGRPSGQVLATGSGYTNRTIKLWELPSFRLLDELSGHEGWISALRFSPDGHTLASGGADQTIRLWDVATWKTRHVFDRLPAMATRLCFSPDGEKLYSGDREGTICRWSARAQQTEPRPRLWRSRAGLSAVTLTRDLNRFAGLRQGIVYVGVAHAATLPTQIPELGTNNTCLLFSPDGRRLFAGTATGEVQVWSLDRREPLHRLCGQTGAVLRIQQARQGDMLVALHREQKAQVGLPFQVAVWSMADGKLQRSFPAGVQYGYAVSPDGRWVATAYNSQPLRLWSLGEPSQVKTTPCLGVGGNLAFSPGGDLLAGINRAGVVQVWKVPTLHEETTFPARAQGLFMLAFSPDGRRLAIAGEGAEALKLWDVATWQELISLPLDREQISQIFFSADGQQLAAANSQDDVLFWRVPSLAEIEAKEKEAKAQ